MSVNSYTFKIVWNNTIDGAGFNYLDRIIEIGTLDTPEEELFMTVCHELWEIAAVEMAVRFRRPDVDSDYIFVYDHRQHNTMANMFSGWLMQFIG